MTRCCRKAERAPVWRPGKVTISEMTRKGKWAIRSETLKPLVGGRREGMGSVQRLDVGGGLAVRGVP